MNQHDSEWPGPRAEYKSLEGALGAAMRQSASSATPEPVYVILAARGAGYRLTEDDAERDEALAAGTSIGAVIADRYPSRKPKSNSTPPPPATR